MAAPDEEEQLTAVALRNAASILKARQRAEQELVQARDQNWENRGHFFAIAARAMRWHLIEYARARKPANHLPG